MEAWMNSYLGLATIALAMIATDVPAAVAEVVIADTTAAAAATTTAALAAAMIVLTTRRVVVIALAAAILPTAVRRQDTRGTKMRVAVF